MTDERFDLSRRKALAALGTIGVASAGAGLGTSAYFSDTETFENNQLVAGELDLKVTASHHYVDWLPDTEGGPDDGSQETDDAGMATGDPDITLDDGDIEGAQPIELDINDVSGFANGSLVNNINGGVPADGFDSTLCDVRPDADGDVGKPVISLQDVKPGDFGFVRFVFASCDNPAFVWLTADITDSSENGYTEPELDDPDEDGPNSDETVELKDNVVVSILEGDIAQALGNGSVSVTRDDNLRGLADKTEPVAGGLNAPEGGGAEDARDCFEGVVNHSYTLVWWVPIDHGNQIQGDSVTFELGLYAEQCRHNDGELNSDEIDTLGETDETDDDAE
jgi:predicted ribosomally synthesized peptide with SipW-like signal peptide